MFSGSHRGTGWFPAWVPVLLLIATVIAIAANGLSRPVSFDGAMNLQVAQSIAEGKGYVREYRGVRPFPREVQTNVPYVLPAAAVLSVFDIGLLQSQIVNFIYMLAFLGLCIGIAARFHGYAAGVWAALALVIVPGFPQIGMNGWGELVALFWWLAGSWLLFKQAPAERRNVAAGCVCLGLAIATKTVMLIGVAATGAVFAIATLAQGRRDPWRAAADLAIALGFLIVPLGLIELWRLAALGGVHQYLGWWSDQAAAITWQSGVFDPKRAPEHSKLVRHFQVLARETQLPIWLLTPWLLIPLVVSCAVLARNPVGSAFRRLWSATLLVVAIYLVWWLMVTPDTHVRLRRIEVGLILAQGLWLCCIGWYSGRPGRSRTRGGAAAVAALVFAGASGLFANDGIVAMRKHWRPDMGGFHRIVDRVRTLPDDARLFGKGFLSSPVLALYADRDLDDVDRYTSSDLAAIGTGYILQDSAAAKARRFGFELRRYPHETLVDDLGYQIYRLDFSRRNNPFRRRDMHSGEVVSWVDFTRRRYPFVFGLHGPSAKGWRWARTDAEILLRYTGQRMLELRLYKSDQPDARPGPLLLKVSVDDCVLGTRELSSGGVRTLRFPIPPECPLVPGHNVRLQIEANNLLVTIPSNLKQLSYVMLAAGFFTP